MKIKENTHLVIKRKLINERLCKKDRELFYALLDIITKENYNEYIICNKDEPYADKVLQTILQGEAKKVYANKIQKMDKQMMNKEIIVDGVDVSSWTDEEVRYKFEKHSPKAIRQIAFDLYKQLKRKEQELQA